MEAGGNVCACVRDRHTHPGIPSQAGERESRIVMSVTKVNEVPPLVPLIPGRLSPLIEMETFKFRLQ